MLKIITLICTLLGIFMAISLEAWLRSRIVKSEATAETYATLRSRNSEFWSIQYLPLILMLAVAGTAIYFKVGHYHTAFFGGGAVLCFVSVLTGSRTVITGSISSSSLAVSGDIRNALKASYRSAAVMGLTVSSIALIGICSLFFFLNTKQIISLIASFGLGVSIVSLGLGLSGNAFSGAYSLTVKSNDFTDYTGMFIGSSADHVETFILSACAAALLAEVGVDTSGITSTFTATQAARYPLIIMACGIAASIFGILTYRARIVKNPAAGVTAGNFVAGALTIGAAVYFSGRILESYVYAFCIGSGIVAALICGEIAKLYSSLGFVFNRNLPNAKYIGAGQSMIFSLSIGMISVVIPFLITGAAMILSYYFANFYGIALAATGINSMAAVNTAVRGFSINTASASEITSVVDPDEESPNPADVLLTASVKTDVVGKTYSAVSTFVTLVAMFDALSVVCGNQTANLLSTSVFIGMMIGAVSVFICAGLIIRSIRITSYVLRDSDSEDKRINTLRGLFPLYLIALPIPVVIGFICSVNGLVAFACSATITGMCVLFSFNNSGRYFDRMATETLGTVIKLMVAVTLVFAPAFIGFGGIF
jgi:K(+)-stimulated pyrophosphate-energized sodium pump